MNGTGKPCRTDIVLPSLEQDGFEILFQQSPHQRDVLVEKLFLKIDRMGADESLPAGAACMQDGGYQVGEGLADTCACLDDEVGASFQGFGHGFRHALLFLPPFKSPDGGEPAPGAEELRHFPRKFTLNRGMRWGEIFVKGDHGLPGEKD